MQTIRLYDTLTGAKKDFHPQQPGVIKLYVCGMTVYDDCHVGHARLYVCIDALVRFFKACGYQVMYVRNITDIDDKIIDRAQQMRQDVSVITQRYIQSMHHDFAQLEIAAPSLEPKATEHIPSMIALIERLLSYGVAYQGQTGDVYFRVAQFPAYGRLSGKDLDGQIAGKRIELVADKEHAGDFVLWKAAKPGEPVWEAPWGRGRPGWHIECSAMAMDYLGETLDIHAGGCDLQFPHHENELAQSEAATGQPFARYWLHVGHLQVEAVKMSKSLRNFTTIKQALAQHQPEVLRYFFLASHYRSPLNYSAAGLQQAHGALSRLYGALRHADDATGLEPNQQCRFNDALADDFNTPQALAVLFDVANQLHKSDDRATRSRLAGTLRTLGGVLGLLQQDPELFFQQGGALDHEYIEQQIAARTQARVQQQWALADRIREQLKQQGIELEDGAQGTTWRINSDAID